MRTGSADVSDTRILAIEDLVSMRIELDGSPFLISQVGCETPLSGPRLVGFGYVPFAIADSNQSVLLCDHYGDDVFKVQLDEATVSAVASLNRRPDDDGGLYRTKFVPTESGCALVYEFGLIAFTTEAEVSWRVDHNYLDDLFDGIADGLLVYENEHAGRWGYRVDSGERVDLKSNS